MDFQGYNNSANQTPPQPTPPPVFVSEKKRKGGLLGFFRGIFTGFSVLIKIVFILMFISIIMFFVSGQKDVLMEDVLRDGPVGTKIAVVSIQDIIDAGQAENVFKQLKAAQKDDNVKAVILRVDSPGGTVSASDQIHHEIMNFRAKTKKTVIAFMQGTAASGGYYASVACEKIIAEPTTITGSIGVISSYLVLQSLLEDKLGVQPVVVKSGEKKDWPSNFRAPSDEEIQYIQDKLIKPTLEIFVNVVAKGRESVLTMDEVKELADGSIFGAQEALEKKLIDDIGYLDDAIDMIKSIARIGDAQVIQYKRPFSLGSIMGVESKQNLLKLDRNTLFELGTPQTLYLWNAY
ncbi:MAG: signal peptide peptidase SppA [Sedimentisphaerales bacterium]|nr:signal peptide peptidase SppA [Sedimentisphaerales bacterium]